MGITESIYYYHLDHLGTPIMLTDSNQQTAWDADYDPFGKATVTTATITNNLRFPGQYYDAETGLHYNWHRYYWPEVGRYVEADILNIGTAIIHQKAFFNRVTSDILDTLAGINSILPQHYLMSSASKFQPISPLLPPVCFKSIYNKYKNNPQRLNLYVYVINNPIAIIDPSGLSLCRAKCYTKYGWDVYICWLGLEWCGYIYCDDPIVDPSCFKTECEPAYRLCLEEAKKNLDNCLKGCQCQ